MILSKNITTMNRRSRFIIALVLVMVCASIIPAFGASRRHSWWWYFFNPTPVTTTTTTTTKAPVTTTKPPVTTTKPAVTTTKPTTTTTKPTTTQVPTTTNPGTIPTACSKGGSYLWSNLATCGWPTASNTGPKLNQCPGGVLTNNSGVLSRVIEVSANNTTISCQNISGSLHITGTGVTISNVKLTSDSGLTGTAANPTAGITIETGASATITNVEINGSKGVHTCITHVGVSMTVSALNCYNVNDGIFTWPDTGYSQTTGDNFIIQDSYFHDFTTRTSNGHIDGFQTEGAGNGLISHNTFLMTTDDNNLSNAAIAIWNSERSSHDITVQNNLIAGGGASVYAEDYSPSESNNVGGFTVTNIKFNNNSFSTKFNPCIGFGPGWDGVAWFRVGPTDGWRRSGNKVLETGENIDNNNPHFSNGSLCS